MAARSISTASLSFGLVTIPVKLYSTRRRESQVSFHWLHAACGTRVKMQWYCPKDDAVVERKDLVRGYEVAKGEHVPVEDEALAGIREEKRDEIGIIEFVPAATVNPLYHEHDYYLAPDRHADRAYAVMVRALENTGQVAVGRYAARGDDHVVVIAPRDGGLVLIQLKFADEIRPIADVPIPSVKITEREVALAEQLIGQYAADELDMTRFKDEVKLRKLKLIEDRLARGEVRETAPAEGKRAAPAQVVDLMAALKASLGVVAGATPRAVAARATAGTAAARTRSHPRATVPRHRTARKAAKRRAG